MTGFGLASHAATLFSAAATRFPAHAAMIHLMALAFLCASVADFRAQPTHRAREISPTRHEGGGRTADRGALKVKRDAASEHLHVLFIQATGCAVLAFDCAVVACVDTTLHRFMGHDSSPDEGEYSSTPQAAIWFRAGDLDRDYLCVDPDCGYVFDVANEGFGDRSKDRGSLQLRNAAAARKCGSVGSLAGRCETR
jgi:hypothetical protein